MNVSKRGDVYRCFERYKDATGRYRKVSTTIKKNTPQERKKALAILQSKMQNPTNKIKFSELITFYINDQKKTCKMSTWTRNEATLTRISKAFGDVYVSSLNTGFIRSHLLDISKTATSFNEYRRRLSSLIRWAYQNDYITSQECIDKLKRLPDASERQKVQHKYLEKEELQKILDSASPYYRNIFEFLALSGLRIGELIALDNDDITADAIHVSKTYDHRNHVLTPPKTPDSNRSVHIQPELADCIARIRSRSNLYRLQTGERPSIFCLSPFGDKISYKGVSREYKRLCEEVLGRSLSLHSLRHTHVALMAEKGISLDAIARRLGHSSSAITKDIYYHVTKETRKKEDALFDAVRIL